MQENVTKDSYDMKDSRHEGILCESHISHTCFRRDHDAGYYWPCPQQSWVVGRAKFSFSLIYAVPVLSLSISTQSTSWTLFQHRKDTARKPCTASRFIRCDNRITSPCYDGKLFNNTVYHQLHLELCVSISLWHNDSHIPQLCKFRPKHTICNKNIQALPYMIWCNQVRGNELNTGHHLWNFTTPRTLVAGNLLKNRMRNPLNFKHVLLTLHLNFPALMENFSSMDNVFCSNTDWEASRVLPLCNSGNSRTSSIHSLLSPDDHMASLWLELRKCLRIDYW